MLDYKMDLPVSEKYRVFNNLLEVNDELYDETYKFAKYFKEELNYDRVPFDTMGILDKPYKAFLFTEEALDVYRKDPMPYRIYGSCLFSKLPIKGDDIYWKLEWIWLHPFFRHRGKLKIYWHTLEAQFGDFFIGHPVSNDMKAFIKYAKSNNKHEII